MLIVVADDDNDLRNALEDVLRAEGYETAAAANGEQAMRIIREAKITPALVLLDLKMPVMDGWDVLRELDDDPKLHKIPVAIMSAHESIRRMSDLNRGERRPTQMRLRGSNRMLLPKPLGILRLLSVARAACDCGQGIRVTAS